VGCMLLKLSAASVIHTHQWSKVEQDMHQNIQQESTQQKAVLSLPGKHFRCLLYFVELSDAAMSM
jgi:hypothetical protein